MRTRLVIGTPDAKPAAAATGATNATAAQLSDRIQSPTVRLSIGTFATVHPMPVPDAKAPAAMPTQTAGESARSRLASPAAAKTSAANAAPPAACQRQRG